jgi:hypothetical protein
VSWLRRLENAQVGAVAHDGDPWRLPLERLHGQFDDGVERITTQRVMDILGVHQRARRSGAYRRLAKLMTELGWSPVRVRGLNRSGFLEQVRGFARCPSLVTISTPHRSSSLTDRRN